MNQMMFFAFDLNDAKITGELIRACASIGKQKGGDFYEKAGKAMEKAIT